MRALLWISVVVMGLWSGYWFLGKAAVERGTDAFFRMAPQQGIEAQNAGFAIAGFPNRFDLTVTEPRLTDPRSGLGWRAPFVQVFSLSYKPWHVIAAFANEQTIEAPGEEIAVASEKLQASVVFTPNAALTLDRSTLIGSGLALTSSRGWTAGARELRFATRQDPSRANAHEIGLDLLNLTPDPRVAGMIEGLPAVIDRLHLDSVAGLSAPLDRFAGAARPELDWLEIREASMTWGGLGVFAKGDLTVSAGVPEGQLDIRVQNWRELMPIIAASNLVKPEVLPTLERIMEVMALQSGDPTVLEMPLVFSGGQMRLGALPLGPAPRF